MNYPVASLVIVVSAVLVLSCRQTGADTDAAKCLTPTTLRTKYDSRHMIPESTNLPNSCPTWSVNSNPFK